MFPKKVELNDAQLSNLTNKLQEWLEDGTNRCVSGLEIGVVEEYDRGCCVLLYSYENEQDKLRRGSVRFTAHILPNKLEDVKFE